MTRKYNIFSFFTILFVALNAQFLYNLGHMEYPEMPKLSERLKYLRVVHNFSQAELAKQAGTTQQAIQQAEKGRARQPRYLHQLAAALEVPLTWMLFGHTDENYIVFDNETAEPGLGDKSCDVLKCFYAMPEKDQKLIHELMKSRRQKH
jgi:transcriptional regulator with XRE-family HTH domain